MSFYVTCYNDNKNVSASMDVNLSFNKYECALVDFYFKNSLIFENGNVEVFQDKEYLGLLRINIDASGLKLDIENMFKNKPIQPIVVHYLNKFVLDGLNTYKFKLDEKAKYYLDIKPNTQYVNKISINIDNLIAKNNIIHVGCDVIKSQTHGFSKKQILRSIYLTKAEDLTYQSFNFLQYVDVTSSQMESINLTFFDKNFNQLEIKSEIIAKIHFKIKK